MQLFQSARLIQELSEVEATLIRAVNSRQPVLKRAAEQLVLAGGKRLRPALTLLGATFGSKRDPAANKIAAAIELLHMATLVHDDIIDNSPLRRGQATVQTTYGNEVAVFTGDWLLTKALLLLAETNDQDRMRDLATAMIHICEAEVSQFAGRNQQLSILDYLRRIHGKTAALFALSIVSGVQQTATEKATIRALGKYGIFFGMAFQIYDDLLDYTAPMAELGKPVGADVQSGIYTLPLLFALEDQQIKTHLESLLVAPCDQQTAASVVTLVAQTSALTRCQDLVARYAEKALQAIAGLPETDAKAELVALPSRLFSLGS